MARDNETNAMSLEEIEAAVLQLPPDQLDSFAHWFEEHLAEIWDQRIEADIAAGKLDKLGERALSAFDNGECTSL